MPRGNAAPPIANASPAWRYVRAGLIALMVAALCAVIVKVTAKRVRDMRPDELRAEMGSGNAKLDTVIATLQRMDFEDRRVTMQSAEAQSYIEKLSASDRKRLVMETMDRGIQQQIERYHKLSKAEREDFIEQGKARQQEERERIMKMSPEEREKRRALLNDANFEQVFEKALKSYLSVTTSEERAELAPLYEGALKNVELIRAPRTGE